jgi:photosystem II stability/assembly factor-like uncharacterized protein
MTSTLYLGTNKGVAILRSEDGQQWELAHQALQSWAVPMVAVSPSAPNRVYAGTRGDGVWVSEDFGASWKKPSFGRRGPGKCRCVAVDPNDPNTVYAGTEPIDLFVSHDGAANWERVDAIWDVLWVAQVDYPPGRPTNAIEPHVRDIAVDPKDPNTVLIGLQVGYMLKSTNGGASWEVLNQDLDADVHSIAIDPSHPSRVWIATGGDYARAGLADGKALYRSENGGANWEPMAMEEFPDHEYSVPIVVNPQDPRILYSSVASGPPSSWAKNPNGASGLVIRSTDAGTSWENLTDALPVQTKQLAQAMAVNPTEPRHVYLAFRGGTLCTSDDGGDTWRGLAVEVGNVEDMKAVTR